MIRSISTEDKTISPDHLSRDLEYSKTADSPFFSMLASISVTTCCALEDSVSGVLAAFFKN